MGRMVRSLMAGAGISAALMLAGCGNSELTISGQIGSGQSAYFVVQSDATAIGQLKTSAASSAAGTTVQDGDHHSGTHVCGWSTNKDGHSYQIDLFASGMSAAQTTQLSAVCNSGESQINSQLP